jgi:UrcA family protein
MTKFSATFASIATLALAAVPALAIATGAHAAPVAVKVSDLDLGTTEGAREFNRRVDVAARTFCNRAADGPRLASAACKDPVRREASQKLVAARTAPTAYAAR